MTTDQAILKQACAIELKLALAKLESDPGCNPKVILEVAKHASLAHCKINTLEQMALGVPMPRRGE